MKTRVMGWMTQAWLGLKVESHGQTLTVTCTPLTTELGWSVIALSFGPDGDTLTESINGALDSHAHENLGIKRTLGEAIECAEDYASKWQRKRQKGRDKTKPCECGPIGVDSAHDPADANGRRA